MLAYIGFTSSHIAAYIALCHTVFSYCRRK